MGEDHVLTIVIPALNEEDAIGETIQRCLDSIWTQDYASTEVVIIDGASSDDTVSIIRRNNDRIGYWNSAPDDGIYDAWNTGLEHATGDWISFVGADDTLAGPDVLTR